ncbi:unnamed protein product [Gordionus sp. m RMFG-2023]
MINPIREDADFESISRNEEIVTSVINHEQEDGGAVGISGILEEGPESISSMINPIREDADFESMGRNEEIVTSVINHEQDDGEDDLHAYRYLKSHFCMPSESTLRAWSSKIEIMPGFLSISFTQIKSYQKKSEKQLYCQYNLIINKSCDDRIKKDECL